jgi:hypothetical protein
LLTCLFILALVVSVIGWLVALGWIAYLWEKLEAEAKSGQCLVVIPSPPLSPIA